MIEVSFGPLVIPTDLPADARAQLLQAGVEESHSTNVRSFRSFHSVKMTVAT